MKNVRLITRLTGIVTPYQGNGRKLGCPTANISIETDIKDGIYFGLATLDRYKNNPALIFVGSPITLGNSERRIEVHLLDIKDKDYYGKQLTIEVYYFHRPNLKLSSLDELIEIIKDDESVARKWFKTSNLLP